jgi:hypothetical protein
MVNEVLAVAPDAPQAPSATSAQSEAGGAGQEPGDPGAAQSASTPINITPDFFTNPSPKSQKRFRLRK